MNRFMRIFPMSVLSLIIAISISFFYYTVVNTTQKILSIPLTTIISDKFIVLSDLPSKIDVYVSGAPSRVDRISNGDVGAFLLLDNFEQTGNFSVPISLQRFGSAQNVSGIELKSSPMNWEVVIDERMQKNLKVVPSITKTPPRGYVLANFTVTPSFVSVSGPRSILSGIESVATADIDMSKSFSDVSVQVQVDSINPLVLFDTTTNVNVSFVIEESVRVQLYSMLEIQMQGLVDDLVIGMSIPFIDLVLQGSASLFNDFITSNIAYMDMTLIRQAGEYSIPVQFNLPDGMFVLSQSVNEVSVVIEETLEATQEEMFEIIQEEAPKVMPPDSGVQ